MKGHSCIPNNFMVTKHDKNVVMLKDFCQESDDTQPYIYVQTVRQLIAPNCRP